MAQALRNNRLESLNTEEIKSILDHMRNDKQKNKYKYINLNSHISENANKIIYIITEARMPDVNFKSKSSVKVYEMTYIVDKTNGEIFQHETCIQERVNKYS